MVYWHLFNHSPILCDVSEASNWKISTSNCSSQQTLTWYLCVVYFPFIIHSSKMVLHLTRSPKLHIRGLMVIPLSATTFSRHPKQLDDGTLKVPILDSSITQGSRAWHFLCIPGVSKPTVAAPHVSATLGAYLTPLARCGAGNVSIAILDSTRVQGWNVWNGSTKCRCAVSL